MRLLFWTLSFLVIAAVVIVALFYPLILWTFVILLPLFLLGVYDVTQNQHAVLKNFPLVGHFRYLLEMIRPEINQYFIESNTNGRPFSREMRSVVYQRAKKSTDTLPFGTQRDVYEEGYEWINHSLAPIRPKHFDPRVRVGGAKCTKPYEASILNISAMSFGSLSKNAILSLNGGARLGGFAHNTGEGGISPYHLEPGGDIIWQIGTGYFGCRDKDGRFDLEQFQERAQHEQVRMIEIKLSQGAKPGHGGILPGAKVTEEIARIRLVPPHQDVLSPPSHSAFSTPVELLEFVQKLREASGGKPVGFKLCLGDPTQFLSICKAMIGTGLRPDYIAVDGGEGGTGAAPLEFSNSVGTPLNEALNFVHNALVGSGLREDIKIIASGRIITGFHIAAKLALGADLCYSARGFLFSLGCIQALRCNTNHCPVGVATQNPYLVKGLVVSDKTQRVANYHKATVHNLVELLGAAGIEDPDDLRPWHIYKRTSPAQVKSYAHIFPQLRKNDLIEGSAPELYASLWAYASPDRF